MEPATASVLYALENVVEGAAALVKGITHPTLPIKANLTRISSVPLPRTQHTVSVVKGRAYIFGGENEAGKLADNAMHVVILPSSGVQEADYTSYPPRAANGLDDVPNARRGHTSAVVADSIYIFGGEGDHVPDERGRVWVFNTIQNTWTYLDPPPGSLTPAQRSGHASASSSLPGPKDRTFRETAPQAPADPSKVVPEPAESDSWGTIFVVGGRESGSGALSNDALAFDVKTRTWTNIPSPDGMPREGASIALVGNRLYRFGGKGTEGTTQVLDASYVWRHADAGTTPLTSGWAWEDLPHNHSHSEKGSSGTSSVPPTRSYAGLVGVTTGQGRRYLLAVGGESENTGFLDDVWALQLPPESSTAAATKDNIRASIKRDTHEGQWAEVMYMREEGVGEKEKEGMGARGRFSMAGGTEVDGATAVVWGGADAGGRVLGDGWMVTVDR